MNKLFLFLIAMLVIVQVAAALPADVPVPPVGCRVEYQTDWNWTQVVAGWQGHDITRPYQSICGVAVQVNGQWHSITEWSNTTVSFSDGTTALLYVNMAGVKAWEVRAPAKAHLDGSIVWDAIPGYVEVPNPRLYLPFQLNKWSTCKDGCVFDPPPPPTPTPMP